MTVTDEDMMQVVAKGPASPQAQSKEIQRLLTWRMNSPHRYFRKKASLLCVRPSSP